MANTRLGYPSQTFPPPPLSSLHPPTFTLHINRLKFYNILWNSREMKEYKSRVESYSREMLRKESQIKELQGRIEIGDGCKYHPPQPPPLHPIVAPTGTFV